MAMGKQIREALGCIGMMAVLALFGAGCSTVDWNQETPSAETAGKQQKEMASQYHHFGDVLIPDLLKVERKSCFVYQTSAFSAGVIVLNGSVDSSTLVTFFENNMTKDNWMPISSFKSPRTVLLYQKENRWCVINVTEKDFINETHVEIWVAPTLEGAETGLLK